MELRQLNYFAKVAEVGSFSEAAKELFVSQSTLSQQVQQLEAEFGEQLLHRTTRRVELTDVGREVLPAVLATLAEADRCRDLLLNVRGLRSGTLRVGVTHTFATLLDNVILDFMKRYPGVRVEVKCRPVEVLMEQLRKRDVDIVLSYRPSEPVLDIESTTLFANRLAAVMSETHPMASCSTLALADVARHPLALPIKGMQARNVLNRLVAQQGLKLDIRMQSDAVNIILSMVAESHLITLLSQATASHHGGLKVIPLQDAGGAMDGCYHLRRDDPPTHAVRRFVDLLAESKVRWQHKIDNT